MKNRLIIGIGAVLALTALLTVGLFLWDALAHPSDPGASVELPLAMKAAPGLTGTVDPPSAGSAADLVGGRGASMKRAGFNDGVITCKTIVTRDGRHVGLPPCTEPWPFGDLMPITKGGPLFPRPSVGLVRSYQFPLHQIPAAGPIFPRAVAMTLPAAGGVPLLLGLAALVPLVVIGSHGGHEQQPPPPPPPVIPEPAPLVLLGTGLVGIAIALRRKRRAGDA